MKLLYYIYIILLVKAIQQSRVNFTTRKPRDTARTVPRETMQFSMRKKPYNTITAAREPYNNQIHVTD